MIVDETGEYLPLGIAETLVGRGITVEVVSTTMFFGDNIILTLDIPHLHPRLHAAGVTLSPQNAMMEVTPAGAVLCRIWDGAARVMPIDALITVMMRDVTTRCSSPFERNSQSARSATAWHQELSTRRSTKAKSRGAPGEEPAPGREPP